MTTSVTSTASVRIDGLRPSFQDVAEHVVRCGRAASIRFVTQAWLAIRGSSDARRPIRVDNAFETRRALERFRLPAREALTSCRRHLSLRPPSNPVECARIRVSKSDAFVGVTRFVMTRLRAPSRNTRNGCDLRLSMLPLPGDRRFSPRQLSNTAAPFRYADLPSLMGKCEDRASQNVTLTMHQSALYSTEFGCCIRCIGASGRPRTNPSNVFCPIGPGVGSTASLGDGVRRAGR